MPSSKLQKPLWDGYFADPQVVKLEDGSYVAFGSGSPAHEAPFENRIFRALTSPDLTNWQDQGFVLERLDPSFGDEYWAPEVCFREGFWWMYYSVGQGISGHHIRVAKATVPTGPYQDQGVVLTPHESFAIDAHPFQAQDGQWYLFFARDVLNHERPGTHLAVARLETPTSIGEVHSVVPPTADWQIYEHGRQMYGQRLDWHTTEGTSVVEREGKFWMTYSGGAWTGPGYGVTWACADHPLGPWSPAPADSPRLLESTQKFSGPGHNSLIAGPDGLDRIVFHSWNAQGTKRQLQVEKITFGTHGPVI